MFAVINIHTGSNVMKALRIAYNLGNLWRRLVLPKRIQLAAAAGEDGQPVDQARPVLLAALDGEPSDQAAVRGRGPAD